MKKKAISAAMLVTFMAAFSNSARAGDKEDNAIDKCLASAMKNILSEDASMECLASEQSRIDEELDSSYGAYLSLLPEKKRNLLIASQVAWRKSLEADTRFNLELQKQEDGSVSAYGPLYFRIAQTSNRVELLKAFMKLYEATRIKEGR